MTSTEERRTGTAETSGEPVRRGVPTPATRTTVTLGPYLVALTEQDLRDRRPTVVMALTYLAPADAARSNGAMAVVQARFEDVLRNGLPVAGGLQQVAESLYAGLAAQGRAEDVDGPAEHGVRITQVAVSLLPRDLTSGQVRPVATVCVTDHDMAGTGPV